MSFYFLIAGQIKCINLKMSGFVNLFNRLKRQTGVFRIHFFRRFKKPLTIRVGFLDMNTAEGKRLHLLMSAEFGSQCQPGIDENFSL
jgi:hypothetical protein